MVPAASLLMPANCRNYAKASRSSPNHNNDKDSANANLAGVIPRVVPRIAPSVIVVPR